MLLIATKIAMLNPRGIPEMICPAYKYMCILDALLISESCSSDNFILDGLCYLTNIVQDILNYIPSTYYQNDAIYPVSFEMITKIIQTGTYIVLQ